MPQGDAAGHAANLCAGPGVPNRVPDGWAVRQAAGHPSRSARSAPPLPARPAGNLGPPTPCFAIPSWRAAIASALPYRVASVVAIDHSSRKSSPHQPFDRCPRSPIASWPGDKMQFPWSAPRRLPLREGWTRPVVLFVRTTVTTSMVPNDYCDEGRQRRGRQTGGEAGRCRSVRRERRAAETKTAHLPITGKAGCGTRHPCATTSPPTSRPKSRFSRLDSQIERCDTRAPPRSAWVRHKRG